MAFIVHATHLITRSKEASVSHQQLGKDGMVLGVLRRTALSQAAHDVPLGCIWARFSSLKKNGMDNE